MSVRAKFRCTSNTPDSTVPTQSTVQLHAVYEENGVNKEWAKYTPAGTVTMTIDNPPAAAQFVPGKDYFLDFAPAE